MNGEQAGAAFLSCAQFEKLSEGCITMRPITGQINFVSDTNLTKLGSQVEPEMDGIKQRKRLSSTSEVKDEEDSAIVI